MATQNPLLDDLAGLMTGAMGAARSAGEEARTAMRGRAEAFIADMDLVPREEVEIFKEIARTALERVEALETRVEALEAVAGKPKRAIKPKSENGT